MHVCMYPLTYSFLSSPVVMGCDIQTKPTHVLLIFFPLLVWLDPDTFTCMHKRAIVLINERDGHLVSRETEKQDRHARYLFFFMESSSLEISRTLERFESYQDTMNTNSDHAVLEQLKEVLGMH